MPDYAEPDRNLGPELVDYGNLDLSEVEVIDRPEMVEAETVNLPDLEIQSNRPSVESTEDQKQNEESETWLKRNKNIIVFGLAIALLIYIGYKSKK